MSEDVFVKITFLCAEIYANPGKKGEIIADLRIVDTAERSYSSEKSPYAFSGKAKRDAPSAGMMYEAEAVVEGGSIRRLRFGGKRPIGPWYVPEEAGAMRARQHSVEVAERAEKAKEKLLADHRAIPALDALRSQYRGLDFYGRIALEATVLAYIRKGA